MSSTNKTTHYDLSQYVSSDKPTYLTDYNGDMLKIDTGINSAQTTADTASTAATNAGTAAETAQTTANTAITNAAAAQSTADGNTTKIGTLANLTTSEKTNLVGAINEVNDKVETTKSNSNVKSYSCSYINEALKEYLKDNTEYKTDKVFIDSNNVEHAVYSKYIAVSSPAVNTISKLGSLTNLNKIIDFTYAEPIENRFSFSGISYEADNIIIFNAILLVFFLLCLIFVRKDQEYRYTGLDKAGIVLNFLMAILAVPVISFLCMMFSIVGSSFALIDQIIYNIPPMAILCLALSVVLRRKGYSKAGFFVQFGVILPFVLVVALDAAL